MRKNIVLLFSFLCFLIACDKDDEVCIGLDCLPAATQTGDGIFGCLIDGKAFVETNTYFNCYYQFNRGEYYFSLSAKVEDAIPIFNIRLATIAAEIEEGQIYSLECNEAGNHFAEVLIRTPLSRASTCNTSNGKLTITTLDFENQIVSGTFEFDIINPSDNSVIEIRNGRFDTLFTR